MKPVDLHVSMQSLVVRPKSLMINTVPSSGISLTFGGESWWIRLSRTRFDASHVTRRRLRGRLAIVAIRFERSCCVSSRVEVMWVAERRMSLLRGLSVKVRGPSWLLNRIVLELSVVMKWMCLVGKLDVGNHVQRVVEIIYVLKATLQTLDHLWLSRSPRIETNAQRTSTWLYNNANT